MENTKNQSDKKVKDKQFNLSKVGFGIVAISVIVTVIVSFVLYQHTVNIIAESLNKRLEAIVNTAAVHFDAADLAALRKEEDYKKPEWNRVVNQLLDIRLNNPDIVFVYILRKNEDDPTAMHFVADSHSLDPYAKIDLDGNGIIDDADALNPPGDPYDDVPVEAFEGYKHTVATGELYEDQWGFLTSGYAPIRDENGETVATIAVDVRAGDYARITRITFIPFMSFIMALVGILLILASSLIKIWNRQVALMAQLDQQKDELLSIVSHQLGTPVSSVKWYIEMMLDGDTGKLTKDQEEHLKALMAVVKELSNLVHMMLDVSRVQLGRLRIDRRDVDLKKVIENVNDTIEPKAKQKNISLTMDLPEPLPTVFTDERLLNLILTNFLTNAVKYTPEGGSVKLDMKVANQQMAIDVTDTGRGIPAEEQGKIFDKLYRASNVDVVEGNGLGLYATKGAVESMGGKIWFVSEENKGSTFTAMIPLIDPGEKQG